MAQILYTLGVVVALGAAIAAVPKIWQGLRWTYHLLRRIDEISRLGPVVVGMAQQFQRNGGASLKDAVVSLKENLEGLAERMGDQDRMLIGIMERMSEVYAVKEQVSDLTGRVGNMGSTLGDLTVTVATTTDAVKNNDAKLEELRSKLEAIEGKVEHLDAETAQHKKNNEAFRKQMREKLHLPDAPPVDEGPQAKTE